MSQARGVCHGDQVIAVNGLSLLGRKYADALELMKSEQAPVELVLSRAAEPEAPSGDNDKAVIVDMIPKQGLKRALPRSLGLGRRWNGPVRYPVTPLKKTGGGEDETSEDEQVFI